MPFKIITTVFNRQNVFFNFAKKKLKYNQLCFNRNSSFCQVTIDEKKGIAKALLRKPPANSLNLEFLRELNGVIENLEKDKTVRGLIITSDVPRIFSAGLDIYEMYNPKLERVREFWSALQQFWMKLYITRLTTIAVINGHSPAGGCLIALSCDYRIMIEGNYSIGLNETLLGIVAPFWFIDSLKNVIGTRQSEKALQLGYLFKPNEALNVGLIDQVVDENSALEAAYKEMDNWLKIPDNARYLTKIGMRKETVDKLSNNKENDVSTFINFLLQDHIQKSLEMYLLSLKKKK